MNCFYTLSEQSCETAPKPLFVQRTITATTTYAKFEGRGMWLLWNVHPGLVRCEMISECKHENTVIHDNSTRYLSLSPHKNQTATHT